MWNCQPGGAELVNYKCAGIRSWVLILAVRDGAYQPRSAPSLEEVKIFFFLPVGQLLLSYPEGERRGIQNYCSIEQVTLQHDFSRIRHESI